MKLSENWSEDPPLIREFVSLAKAEGFRLTSIEQRRQILLRFEKFLKDHVGASLKQAGWQEYASYKALLAGTGVARSTIRCYLSYLTSFYRLWAQASQDPKLLDIYTKVKALDVVRKARSTRWKPLDLAVVPRLLQAATGEDRIFLMTLLWTGGRVQFYELRVEDVDFEREEITTVVKGGKVATIPLRPTLAVVLRDHLERRCYASAFVFRNGKDMESRRGQRANRQNAWRIYKRVQRAASIEESVHPHRFGKTLATYGKQMGLDPQFLQVILAHESVNITLDEYARVDLADVKREFTNLDLLTAVERQPSGRVEQSYLLGRLRDVAPPGKERAWQMIIEGLEAFLGKQTPSADASP